MTRACTICIHPQRAAIESAVGDGTSYRDIALQFSVGHMSVARHQAEHMSVLPTQEVTAYRDNLIEEKEVHTVTPSITINEAQAGDLHQIQQSQQATRNRLAALRAELDPLLAQIASFNKQRASLVQACATSKAEQEAANRDFVQRVGRPSESVYAAELRAREATLQEAIERLKSFDESTDLGGKQEQITTLQAERKKAEQELVALQQAEQQAWQAEQQKQEERGRAISHQARQRLSQLDAEIKTLAEKLLQVRSEHAARLATAISDLAKWPELAQSLKADYGQSQTAVISLLTAYLDLLSVAEEVGPSMKQTLDPLEWDSILALLALDQQQWFDMLALAWQGGDHFSRPALKERQREIRDRLKTLVD